MMSRKEKKTIKTGLPKLHINKTQDMISWNRYRVWLLIKDLNTVRRARVLFLRCSVKDLKVRNINDYLCLRNELRLNSHSYSRQGLEQSWCVGVSDLILSPVAAAAAAAAAAAVCIFTWPNLLTMIVLHTFHILHLLQWCTYPEVRIIHPKCIIG